MTFPDENANQDGAVKSAGGESTQGDNPSDQHDSPPPYPEEMMDYAPEYMLPVRENWREGCVFKTVNKKLVLEKASLHNTILFIENIFPNIFILNEFSDEIFLVKCPPWDDSRKFFARPYQQFDIIQLSAALEKCGMSADLRRTDSAIKVVARKNSIHPVRARFNKMEWDRVPRLATWLKTVTESEQDGAYLAKIGTSWLVGAVARIFKPGTKFDHMLVLEGVGGKGKSAAVRLLSTFGKEKEIAYFSDSIALDNVTHSSSIAKMQGKLIIEFAELDGMSKADDSTLKNFLAQTQDEVQKKFENPVTVYQRQCVFAGTTNEDEYLKDTTGNRRYWPVKIKEIHLDKLREMKDQLWSEAIHLYKNGYEFFINDRDPIYGVFLSEQSLRLTSDPWEEIIRADLRGISCVYLDHVVAKVVSDVSKRDQRVQRRVTGIMRKLGFKSVVIRSGNDTERKWERKITGEPLSLADQPEIAF